VVCRAHYGRACRGSGQGCATCGVRGAVRQGVMRQRAGSCHMRCARPGRKA
jgi:hypothetical protein